MNDEHVKIIDAISKYLELNPDLRFSQALFNLNINEFADKRSPERKGHLLRNICKDSDEKVWERIRKH